MNRPMRCEEVIAKLYAYLDEDVDEDLHADIDEHLADCRECMSRAEFERLLRRKVASTSTEEVPEDVEDRLMALIKRF